jgi:ribosomal protein S18 acetylase RimI-like enzyme
MIPDIQSDAESNVTIRKVTADDLGDLLHISKQTYFESFFEAFNDPDAFAAYTAEIFAPGRLKAELSDLHSEFYFAIHGSDIVGYIKINSCSAQTVFQDNNAAEIERMYILAAHQNRQIGSALLEHAMATAKSKGLKCIWLGVWENNKRAIRFYERHALFKFNTHRYKVGHDDQTDFLMKICF